MTRFEDQNVIRPHNEARMLQKTSTMTRSDEDRTARLGNEGGGYNVTYNDPKVVQPTEIRNPSLVPDKEEEVVEHDDEEDEEAEINNATTSLRIPGQVDVSTLTPIGRLRYETCRLLNEPSSSRTANYLSIFLVLLILCSVVVMVIATVPDYEEIHVLGVLEVVFAIIFTVELGIRILVQYPVDTAKNFFKSMGTDLFFYIDGLAVLPTYIDMLVSTTSDGLQLLKALRVVRLFKLFRQFQGSITLAVAIEESLSALTVPFFFLMVSATTFGVFVYYIENIGVKMENGSDADPTFHSIPHSIWFIFVTMTTVGYGDVSPISAIGRTINIFAMIFGVLFLSMPLAILGNNFCVVWSERDRITVIARIKETLMHGGVNKKDTLLKAFAAIDTDQSGAVNYKEFAVALRELNINLNKKARKKLWESIDLDGSNEVKVSEFADLLFPDEDFSEDLYRKEKKEEAERTKKSLEETYGADHGGESGFLGGERRNSRGQGSQELLDILAFQVKQTDEKVDKVFAKLASLEAMITKMAEKAEQHVTVDPPNIVR